MAELTPSQIVGLVGGILGSLIGIAGGIVGWLCSKNRKKHQSLLMGFLLTTISLGVLVGAKKAIQVSSTMPG